MNASDTSRFDKLVPNVYATLINLTRLEAENHRMFDERPADERPLMYARGAMVSAAQEVAKAAWRTLFKTVAPPTVFDETQLTGLRDWFNERIDGEAPAAAVPCTTVVNAMLDAAEAQVIAAQDLFKQSCEVVAIIARIDMPVM